MEPWKTQTLYKKKKKLVPIRVPDGLLKLKQNQNVIGL